MSIFSRKRPHLRAVDLAAVPVSGPAQVVTHRSAGEVIGSKVDDMVRAANRCVDLECELGKARHELRQHQVEMAEAVKALGIPPDILAQVLASRRIGEEP